MTLTSVLTKVQYNGDDSTTAFPVTFIYYEDVGIRVILTVDSTGVETVQTLTTHYTLSGGSGSTGTLTMLTPPATGETLTIKSAIADTQETKLPLGGDFPSTSVEQRLDILTRLVQQQAEEIARAVLLSESSATGAVTFPEPVANKAILWNAAGDDLENSTNDFDDIVSYAEEWAIKAEDSAVSSAAGGDGSTTFSALHWAAKAAADLVLTNADVVLTGNDVTATNADVVLTNADVVSTGNDVTSTNADVVSTGNDVTSTNADVVSTGNDVTSTNADVVSTNADVVLTNADVVTTNNVVGSVASQYVFSTTLTMADPGAGLFRLNNATPASATLIAIDDTTNATGNPDISAFLATWDDSTSTIKGFLSIVQEDDPTKFMVFSISSLTDNAGWMQFTVVHVAGTTLFGNTKNCRIQFTRNGDKGDTGATGADGAGTPRNLLINGNFVINQRSYVSAATLATTVYGHDRWKAGAGGGDYSFTQLKNSTTITIASGKTLIQVVEDANVEGGTYTLSWTGTAQARAGVDSATPSGAYASSPLTISSQTAGTVMSVEFDDGTLGEVQLESGSSASDFEQKDIEAILAQCQRYYYRIGGNGASRPFGVVYVDATTTARITTFFPVPMRIIYTALEQNGVATDYEVRVGATATVCSAVPTVALGTRSMATTAVNVASGLTVGQAGEGRQAGGTSAGYLAWSAEL